MAKIVKYFGNGGKKDLFFITMLLSFILFLIRTSASFGDYRRQFLVTQEQVNKNVEYIEVIKDDLGEIKADVRVIKTYVTKELR